MNVGDTVATARKALEHRCSQRHRPGPVRARHRRRLRLRRRGLPGRGPQRAVRSAPGQVPGDEEVDSGSRVDERLAAGDGRHPLTIGQLPSPGGSCRAPCRYRGVVADDVAPEKQALLALIRDSVIGEDHVMETPYGARRVTYADYTASGRALTFIEDFIRDQVLPSYANTHTESSGTGLQTTRLREEARAIIRDVRRAATTTPSCCSPAPGAPGRSRS